MVQDQSQFADAMQAFNMSRSRMHQRALTFSQHPLGPGHMSGISPARASASPPAPQGCSVSCRCSSAATQQPFKHHNIRHFQSLPSQTSACNSCFSDCCFRCSGCFQRDEKLTLHLTLLWHEQSQVKHFIQSQGQQKKIYMCLHMLSGSGQWALAPSTWPSPSYCS